MIPTISGEARAAGTALPVRAGGRSPLGRLLHALNQPLTGLQCSMEVALASPRTPEQYVQGLREGLELTERMRALVEAIREVEDGEEENEKNRNKNKNKNKDKDKDKDNDEDGETTDLKILLGDVVEDLEPVAAAKQVRITFECAVSSLAAKAGPRRMGAVIFRFVESALSLAEEGTALEIECGGVPAESLPSESWIGESWIGESWIRVRWRSARPHAEFSRPELGLLVAQAGWKRAGARWERERTEKLETVTVRLPGVRADLKPGKAQAQ